MKFKIGQGVLIKEDFEMNTFISNSAITVKKGDRGYMDSNGLLHLISGAGRGKITNLEGTEIEGYHHENIAKMIADRLNAVYNIKEFLDYEEISEKEFKEEIEDLLMDIL